jgi:hypothetical protein
MNLRKIIAVSSLVTMLLIVHAQTTYADYYDAEYGAGLWMCGGGNETYVIIKNQTGYRIGTYNATVYFDYPDGGGARIDNSQSIPGWGQWIVTASSVDLEGNTIGGVYVYVSGECDPPHVSPIAGCVIVVGPGMFLTQELMLTGLDVWTEGDKGKKGPRRSRR